MILLAVVATSVGGCGQSEDREQIRDVAAGFAVAVGDGDGGAACELLTEATAEELEEQEGEPCESAVLQLRLDPGAVAHVRVYVTNGQATYDTGESSYLDRGPDGWRLSAIGCRFDDGKPQSRPATCEAQS
jgi:hypothetical protein